jgi:hypothetical protein
MEKGTYQPYADEFIDAFGRLRISSPLSIFSSQLQYDLEPYQYEAFTSGDGATATHSANTRMAEIKVNAGATGGTSGMQSYQYSPYQAGKSHAGFITAVFGPPTAGAIKRVGYFDDANGIFFQQDGDGVYSTVLRSSTSGQVVERKVEQSQWNELSNVTRTELNADLSNCQIFCFDLQFLGMGAVRMGLDIDGKINMVNTYYNANILRHPYMQTGTLPVRAEVVAAAGLESAATLYLKCAEVHSEGGTIDDFAYALSATATATAASGAATHLISIRPKTTFNSIVNRIYNQLNSFDLLPGNNPVKFEICIGSTFSAAPTWADVNTALSGMEVGSGGTVSNVGTVIAQGFVASTASVRNSATRQTTQRYPITLNKAGQQRANGTISVFVTGIGGTSACQGVLNWQETR